HEEPSADSLFGQRLARERGPRHPPLVLERAAHDEAELCVELDRPLQIGDERHRHQAADAAAAHFSVAFSSARMSLSGWHGLVKNPAAPAVLARVSRSLPVSPVSTTTGSLGRRALISDIDIQPSRPGILRSITTTSN